MFDEDLQIVEAAEQGLSPLHRGKAGSHVLTAGFRRQFRRVSELLQRNADGVEPLRHVHGAGGVDR